MAQLPQVYERQVAPGGTTPVPMSDGGGTQQIARAVGEVGDTLHATELRAYQVQRKQTADREMAGASARLAQFQLDRDKLVIDARTNTLPGAAGHSAVVEKLHAPEVLDGLLADVTETSVKEAISRQFNADRANTLAREYEFETGVASAKVATDFQTARMLQHNRMSTIADPLRFKEFIASGVELAESLHGVPDHVRRKLIEEDGQATTAAMLTGMIDKGQAESALRLVDTGALDAFLTEAQKRQFRDEGRIAVDRATAVAQQQAVFAQRADREELATIKSLLANGVTVDPARVARAKSAALARGDASAVTDLGIAETQIGTLKVAEKMTPVQRADWRNKLAALRHPTAAQEVQLKFLDEIRERLDSRFDGDPNAFLADNDMAPPSIDLASGKGLAERAQWARTTGGELLGPAERNALKFAYGRGPEGREAAATMLANAARHDGIGAERAAQQIAPSDAVFRFAFDLRADYRALVFAGEKARKADKHLVPDKESRERFRVVTAFATAGLTGDFRAGLGDAAGNIYAAIVARNAPKDGSDMPFQPAAFDMAVHMALGGDTAIDRLGRSVKRGGIGMWRNAPLILPTGMSQEDFDKRLSRGAMSNRSGNGQPVWRTGEPVKRGQLTAMTPVAVGDGVYQFRDAGGAPVTLKTGVPFVLDINQVALP